MDVVKTEVEKVSGTVELHSEPGRGTRVSLKVPLTLSIIPALMVTAGGQRYAVPQAGLREVLRLDDGPGPRVEDVNGAPVCRLRGKLLPLVRLDRVLGLPATAAPGVSVVVLHACGRPIGLVVDEVHDTEEIVVKPLARLAHKAGVFAGATIRGDGRVTLILDALGVADGRRPAETAAPPPRRAEELHQLLICSLGPGRLAALPLPLIERLEELPEAAVERAARGEVVQHRGRILPLVRLVERPPPGAAPQWLVVCGRDGRHVGVAVERVLDAVESPLEVQEVGRVAGMAGSAVIRGRVTDVVDKGAVFSAAWPGDAG
jgi:two-component system chemotaxis sensor kinase CheA